MPDLSGWYFVSAEPREIDGRLMTVEAALHDDLTCIYLYNEQMNTRIRGLESAPELVHFEKEERDKKVQEFYESFFGVHLSTPVDDHVLLKRGFCQEWLGAKDQVIAIYGTIVACKKDFCTGELRFTVEFHEASQKLANLMLADIEMSIPRQKEMHEPMAWGGCLLFDERVLSRNIGVHTLDLNQVPNLARKWIAPRSVEMQFVHSINADTLESNNGRPLPRRILTIRGFKFVLEVAKSVIPGAGLGVFASCLPLFEHESKIYFELRAGEMLDLGVYAPLRASDKKPDYTAMLKNFLLEWKSQVSKNENLGFCTSIPATQFDFSPRKI